MTDSRVIRNATIAVWAVAALLVVGIAFATMNKAPAAPSATATSNPGVSSSGRGLPVVYEFSTET